MTELKFRAQATQQLSGLSKGTRYGAESAFKHSARDALPARAGSKTRSATSTWSSRYAARLRISDAAVTTLVVAVAYLWRFGLPEGQVPSLANGIGYLWVCLTVVAVWNFELAYFRSRDKRVYGAGVTEYKRVVQATLRSFGVVAIALLVFQIDISRGFLAVALPLGIILMVGERWLWRGWLNRQRSAGKSLSKVVVLGNPQDVEYVMGQLRDNLSAGYKVAGAALTTLQPDMELLPPWYDVPVLSTAADIAKIVDTTRAEAVVVAGALPGGPRAIQELGWRLEDMSTELVLASSLTNVAGPRVHFRPLEGLPLMHVELPQFSGGKHIVKRVMDIVLAAAALMVLLPVFLCLSLIVKLDSPGSVFFFQERVGRNGETFKMAKFRSMVADAEDKLTSLQQANEGAGVLFKMAQDPRITRCGRWMRRFSLDELPQFWNVLQGQMSLVGPRPPLPREVAQYQQPVQRRLLIKPGITGPWQVNGRSNLAWDEAVRLDLYYVENWSLTGDIIILWRTFKAVAAPTGAY